MGVDDKFEGLLARHEADIRAFVGAIVRDHHAREDVFQEVALTLWRKFDTYDSGRSFGAWARGIAAHKVLRHQEKNSRFPVCFSPATIQAVLDAFDRTEHQASPRGEALQECVKLLPPHARRILTLHYHDGLKPPEIASQTGQTIGALYQSLSRIRAKLADCIRQRMSLETGEA
jgi:RNA polymerase sigma-70 factor (ECF subfamily)